MIFFTLYPIFFAVSSATFLHQGPLTALFTHATPFTSHQYLSQDTLGQYSYGYTGAGSSKSELKLLDGVTRGSYSYFDANGKLQTVKYVADDVNGFQVAATNLPIHHVEKLQPVQDTEEVRQAKEKHLAAVKEAEKKATEILENENDVTKENGNDEDTIYQNNANEDNQLPLTKDLTLKSNGYNYQTSYVHVTSPQNSYTYSIYDPNSAFLTNGYAHEYANYRQPFLLNYNTFKGNNLYHNSD